jgi:hypothetical protein
LLIKYFFLLLVGSVCSFFNVGEGMNFSKIQEAEQLIHDIQTNMQVRPDQMRMNAIESILVTIKDGKDVKTPGAKIAKAVEILSHFHTYLQPPMKMLKKVTDPYPEGAAAFKEIIDDMAQSKEFPSLPHGVRAHVRIALETIKNNGNPPALHTKMWIRFTEAVTSLKRAVSRVYSKDPTKTPQYLTALLKVEGDIANAFKDNDLEKACDILNEVKKGTDAVAFENVLKRLGFAIYKNKVTLLNITELSKEMDALDPFVY